MLLYRADINNNFLDWFPARHFRETGSRLCLAGAEGRSAANKCFHLVTRG
jgi:hypothetical protein